MDNEVLLYITMRWIFLLQKLNNYKVIIIVSYYELLLNPLGF